MTPDLGPLPEFTAADQFRTDVMNEVSMCLSRQLRQHATDDVIAGYQDPDYVRDLLVERLCKSILHDVNLTLVDP